MATHAERVLSGILDKENPRRDLLGVALVRLQPEHFTVDTQRNIFKILQRYYDRTGEVIPQATFISSLEDSGVEAAKVLAYSKQYESLAIEPTTEADFKWSVDELRAEAARRQTGVVITEAMEILERGYEVGRDFLKGHEDARNFLMSRLHEIDKLTVTESAPEGNIFVEREAILADYEDRKNHRGERGILTGVRILDDRTDGMQNGELIVPAGYAGSGKSQFCTQATWHCAVMQKKNVMFATSETLRPQVMRRILARHSRLPMFGKPEGINAAEIKKGTLSSSDEKILRDVVEDWYYNKEYGQLNVVQIPPRAKLSYVENRLREWSKEVDVALIVDDYIALHDPEVRRPSRREEYNDIIQAAKGIAQGFMDGRGIPFMTPWQIKREAYDQALSNGFYTKTALSDTSEIEKSADQIITMLRPENESREISLQYLKLRDDDIPPIQTAAIDFRSTYIGAHHGTQSLAPVGSTSDDLMRMLG